MKLAPLSALLILIPALLLSAPPAPADAPADDALGPNILVRVTPVDRAQSIELRDAHLDVITIRGGAHTALVTDEQLADLAARGFSVEVIDEDVLANLRAIKALRGDLGAYTTYSEMQAKLNSLTAAYPALAKLDSIGTGHEGRQIYSLKISDNVALDEDEPEVLFMAALHSRELITPEVALAIADSLLMNYGSDPRFTGWVDEREIWILPMANPDGHVYCEDVNSNWRKNRRDNGDGTWGVDLNRNFAYEWGHDNNGSSPNTGDITYRGPSAASEPEIQAIQNFVNTREFVFSISFHSYSNLWLWGPAYKPGFIDDQDVFAGYGTQVEALNGYFPGNPGMGALYIVNGGSDDWLYSDTSHDKIFAMTPEIGGSSDGFYPPESRIAPLVEENMEPSFLALQYAARPGQLAPPGPLTLDPIPNSDTGTYDVVWHPPTVADTEPVEYELIEKTGPAIITEGLESGTDAFALGGWSRSSTRKYAGTYSLYSGQGNELNRICWSREGYEVQPGDSFTFRAWYDIESEWDYAYVLLSTDGTRTHVNLAGTGTSMSDPNGNNADNGISGSSGGWQLMTYDLSAWVGQTVWFGFRYYTDTYVQEEGFYVDDIHPVQTWATTTVVSSTIPDTTTTISGKSDGTYTYAVRGHDAEGEWGYFSANESVTVTLVSDVAIAGTERHFSLEPNVPNPFRSGTRIRFTLPERGKHRLSVYDVAGRRVRVLSEGVREAGTHTVAWDGRNAAGRLSPAGIYFYRLEASAGRLEGRAVLSR